MSYLSGRRSEPITAGARLAARSGNGRSFHGGTEGSNPPPSSGESPANLEAADVAAALCERDQANPDFLDRGAEISCRHQFDPAGPACSSCVICLRVTAAG
jgi:hypothetical protein